MKKIKSLQGVAIPVLEDFLKIKEGFVQLAIDQSELKDLISDADEIYVTEWSSDEGLSELLSKMAIETPSGLRMTKILAQLIIPIDDTMSYSDKKIFTEWFVNFFTCDSLYWGVYRQPLKENSVCALRIVACMKHSQ